MFHQDIDYLSLVTKDWRNLQQVPADKQTEAVCLAAIEQNGTALRYVSTDRRTEELCLLAVNRNGYALNWIEKDKQTEALCLAAVKQNGNVLRYVAPDKQTEALCLAAVMQCGNSLDYVAADKQTEAVCLAAVKQTSNALQYVAADKQIEAVCLAAVQQNSKAILYVVPEKQTEAVCLTAVKQDSDLLKWIAKEKQTEAVCLAAIKQNAILIKYVDPDNQTEAVCLAAVKQNPILLKHVAPDKQTEAICLAAITQDGYLLKGIAADKQTEAVCLAAVQQNSRVLQYVESDKQTEAVCLAAVKQNPILLKHVAPDKRTETICLAAVQQNPDVLLLVPDQFKEKIINQLGVQFFSASYEVIKSFPSSYKQEADVLLSQKAYILITQENNVEVKDAKKVYLSKKKNAISVDPRHFCQLLNDLKSVNNIQDLHFVLIGHCSTDADHIASLSANEIRKVCKKYPNIKHVHLIGCKAARAKTLATEKTMIAAYNTAIQSKVDLKYGLQITTNAPHHDADFQKKCLTFCKKNKLNGLYILSKDDDKHYRLMVMKLDSNDHFVKKISLIPAANIAAMDKITNKKLVFPKKKAVVNTVCGPQNPLTYHQLAAVRALTSDKERFYADHPKYQSDKKRYPFLATLEANSNELTQSLLKKLVKVFQNKPVIQDINIKAASNIVSVDGYKKCFLVSKESLYKNDYQTTFYNTNTSNIKYEELAKERKKCIEAITTGSTPTNTMAKNIRVVLPGKKVI